MRDPKGLLDELQAGISELTTSERWQRYLDVQSRFYSYSANNVMLIALQKPNATRVAGYKTWQSLDHQVRAKELALRILAPMRYQKDDGPEGEVVREVNGFKLVPVFDVSQTDGPELPEAVSRLEGLAPEGVFERLTEFAHGIGFRVERPESLGDGANGDTTHASGVIRVVSAHSEAQQAKTLAHEIAHALLHDPESVTTKDLSRGLKELEAESAAYVICTALGMDTKDYSFGYVLGWTGGATDAVEGIRASTCRIQRAATAVLKTFEVEGSAVGIANKLDIDRESLQMHSEIIVEDRREGGYDRSSDRREIDQMGENRVGPDNTNMATEGSQGDALHSQYLPRSATELEVLDVPAFANGEIELGG